MNILVDCRMLNMSGIGRYIKNVISGLAEIEPGLKFTLLGKEEELSEFISSDPHVMQAAEDVVPFTAPIYSIEEQIAGSLLLRKLRGKMDISFFPHYNVPWSVQGPAIVTVHDLIQFKFPRVFGRTKVFLARRVLVNALEKSDRIISVSHSTAADVRQFGPSFGPKIRVIYNCLGKWRNAGASEEEVTTYKKQMGLLRYILYVGNRKPHKNLSRLLKAYSNVISHSVPDVKLVVVGKVFNLDDEVVTYKAKRTDIIEITNCSDDELNLLYRGADVLALPSLYEGFGLPPLEAMACGTPVVVSKVASLPEVVGDAGVYVDPYDVEDIARGIYTVLSDSKLRAELRRRGMERAKLFSWEKTAKKTLTVFEEVMRERRR